MVGESYWRQAINFDVMIEEGVIAPADLRPFVFRETARDSWTTIVQWHESPPRSVEC
jgi:predicted Rossmann-fold nucleotide-binding protein